MKGRRARLEAHGGFSARRPSGLAVRPECGAGVNGRSARATTPGHGRTQGEARRTAQRTTCQRRRRQSLGSCTPALPWARTPALRAQQSGQGKRGCPATRPVHRMPARLNQATRERRAASWRGAGPLPRTGDAVRVEGAHGREAHVRFDLSVGEANLVRATGQACSGGVFAAHSDARSCQVRRAPPSARDPSSISREFADAAAAACDTGRPRDGQRRGISVIWAACALGRWLRPHWADGGGRRPGRWAPQSPGRSATGAWGRKRCPKGICAR